MHAFLICAVCGTGSGSILNVRRSLRVLFFHIIGRHQNEDQGGNAVQMNLWMKEKGKEQNMPEGKLTPAGRTADPRFAFVPSALLEMAFQHFFRITQFMKIIKRGDDVGVFHSRSSGFIDCGEDEKSQGSVPNSL
jgi:hypothetical protein